MRLLLSILILVLIFTLTAFAGDYEVTKVGSGRYFKWSPNGEFLSFYRSEKIMVWEVATGEVREVGPAKSIYFEWLSNEQLICTNRELVVTDTGQLMQTEVYTLTLDGELETTYVQTVPKLDHRFHKLERMSDGDVVVFRSAVTPLDMLRTMMGGKSVDTSAYFVISNDGYWHLRDWGGERDRDLYLMRLDGSIKRRITHGKTYGLPQLSPDGRYIACWTGRLTVLNLEGEIVGFQNEADLGNWLPDSRRLVFAKTRYGDGTLDAGDIFVVDYDGKNEIQITDTPEKTEIEPLVSPDMTMLAYMNYTDGIIEVMDVEEVLK